MNAHSAVGGIVLAAALASASAAQSAPSVLDLQKSYHLGFYAGTVEVGTGSLRQQSSFGDLDLTLAGTFSGLVDQLEADPTGAVSTPMTISGEYTVRPDGIMIMDFDPSNPGTDLLSLWVTPTGSVIHAARADNDEESISVLAIEKSTGMTLASLSGSYYFAGQRMEFAGNDWNTFGEWGALDFDGLGGGTVNGTEQTVTPSGSTSQAFSGPFAYTVAPDGAITIEGSNGAMSADGELLFVMTAEPASGEVGMAIAVRTGSTYDLNDLVGRYGISGQSYVLGTATGAPRTGAIVAEVDLQASGTAAGAWSLTGITTEGTTSGVSVNPLTASGSSTLSANGLLTLSDPPDTIELGVSAAGRYFTGRQVGSETSLFFGSRQCATASSYGTGTSGTGGAEPVLGMKTFPLLGNASWRYSISQALGGSIAVVPISLGQIPGVPALGGLIWIDPLAVGYTPLVLLGGAPGSAGTGGAEAALPIPNSAVLVGLSLYAQALVLDGAAPAGFAMSAGFVATICR